MASLVALGIWSCCKSRAFFSATAYQCSGVKVTHAAGTAGAGALITRPHSAVLGSATVRGVQNTVVSFCGASCAGKPAPGAACPRTLGATPCPRLPTGAGRWRCSPLGLCSALPAQPLRQKLLLQQTERGGGGRGRTNHAPALRRLGSVTVRGVLNTVVSFCAAGWPSGHPNWSR